MSDFIPNSFQTPNAYVDQLMSLLTGDEWKVLSYMARRVFGFNKREDRISLSQMEHGITNSNGVRLDYGTGLSRPALVKALSGLKKHNVVCEVAPNDSRCNEGALYAPQMDSSKVDWQGLEARRTEAKERGRTRTGKARSELKRQREDSAVSEANQQESGKSGLPHPVSETNRTQLDGLTHKVSVEIQGKSSIPQANESNDDSLLAPPEQPQQATLLSFPVGSSVDRSKARKTNGNGSQQERKKGKSPRAPNPNTLPIMDAYIAALGYSPANYAKESGFAKRLADAGYTPDQVASAYRHLKAQPFWKDKFLSLCKVAEQIGEIFPPLGSANATKVASGGGSTGYRFLNDETMFL